ncbi:MAG: endonuclease/exonuclease/phosphatase family protein [Pseudomonadota bacterium]
MPNYNDLRPSTDKNRAEYRQIFPHISDPYRAEIIRTLQKLRMGLDMSHIPARRAEDNLIIATWNIQHFGSDLNRTAAGMFCLAEIIARFDLVAIQELKSDLSDLKKLLRLLGEDWTYIVSDVNYGTKGNYERMCYIYNASRVRPSGLVSELSPWDEFFEEFPDLVPSDQQRFLRAPYVMGFETAWKAFSIMSLHLKPNDNDTGAKLRADEMKLILALLDKKDKERWIDNLIITGDFNFFTDNDKDAETIAFLNQEGFSEHADLIGKPTTLSKKNTYDRFFLRSGNYFELSEEEDALSADVLDPFEFIFKADGAADHAHAWEEYKLNRGGGAWDQTTRRYNDFRKRQLSDHLPVWFSLKADNTDEFLDTKLEENEENL